MEEIELEELLEAANNAGEHQAPALYRIFIHYIQIGEEDTALDILDHPLIQEIVRENAPKMNHAFVHAAGHNRARVAAKLLEFNEVAQNITVDNNYALRLFAAHNNVEAMQLLLKNSAVRAKIDSDNYYALHFIIKNGHMDLYKLALQDFKLLPNSNGMRGAVKYAYKADYKFMLYDLYKHLGSSFNDMQKKWQNKLKNAVNEVLDFKVLLKQICRHNNPANAVQKIATTPLYSLPVEIHAKIAAFAVNPDECKKDIAPLLYMFCHHKHAKYILDELDVAETNFQEHKKPVQIYRQ